MKFQLVIEGDSKFIVLKPETDGDLTILWALRADKGEEMRACSAEFTLSGDRPPYQEVTQVLIRFLDSE